MHMELTDVAPAAKDVGAADALFEIAYSATNRGDYTVAIARCKQLLSSLTPAPSSASPR